MKTAYTINRFIEIGLRIIGVWPNSQYAVLHRVFWMMTMGIAQAFQYRYFIIHVRSDDLLHLMDGLSTTMSYSLLFLKLIIFWVNRRTFHNILVAITRDWDECEPSDNVMTRTAYISDRSSNLIIGLFSMSVFLYGTGVLVVKKQPNGAPDPSNRELFLKMELPFESSTSPAYELVMIVQFIHQLAAATVVGVLNALIVTLILHVGGQIDIMRRGLEEVSAKKIQVSSSITNVAGFISKHQRIITFSNDIEKLFSYIALVQFFLNTLIICALGFLIVVSVGDTQGSTMLVKSLFYYIAIMLEVFIFCYAGEYLSEKGKMIGEAAYKSHWYNLRPTESRVMMLIILRSQKQLTITVGKFMDLSLERFTTIIKASASYVSVLYAMNS